MDKLLSLLLSLPSPAVALSGGLDSRFLAHAALLADRDPLLLHASGPHIAPAETERAARWAESRGLDLRILPFDPLALPAAAHNSRGRCYHCKKALIELLKRNAPGRTLCDGSQADDLRHPHRPGNRALKEAGVRSPLAELGLGKTRIRALAAEYGLEQPEQAARPCLLTRLPYGMRPDPAVLARIAAAEAALEELGLAEFRLRLTPEPQLHYLHLPEGLKARLPELLARHGFAGAPLVRCETLSGFFDHLPVKGNAPDALRIRPAEAGDLATLVLLWERSVRATHHFLSEDDILFYTPFVRDMLPGAELWVAESPPGTPAGFMLLEGHKVEALFLDPPAFGLGLGRALLRHARALKGPLVVDVNEDNAAALAFYERRGFVRIGRSPLDGAGRPFPLLHLAQPSDEPS